MELNIVSFTYLFLRLAPFVLVSFFSLASIFNQDFKGLVYLVGLLVACFINIQLGSIMPRPESSDKSELCNMISINEGGDISKLPLGQAVFGRINLFPWVLYADPWRGNGLLSLSPDRACAKRGGIKKGRNLRPLFEMQ
jgi:hypothetical protein